MASLGSQSKQHKGCFPLQSPLQFPIKEVVSLPIQHGRCMNLQSSAHVYDFVQACTVLCAHLLPSVAVCGVCVCVCVCVCLCGVCVCVCVVCVCVCVVCVCVCVVCVCVCFPNTMEIILILLATRHNRIHLLKNLISKLSSYIYVCIWPCNVYSR